jgi:hypothetical protein
MTRVTKGARNGRERGRSERYDRDGPSAHVEPPRWRQALWRILACVQTERCVLADAGDRGGAAMVGEIEASLRARLGAAPERVRVLRAKMQAAEEADDGD